MIDAIKTAGAVILAVASFPIMILSWLAAPACAVWLLIRHDWKIVVDGIVIGVVSPWLIGLVLGAAVAVAALFQQYRPLMAVIGAVLHVITFFFVIVFASVMFNVGIVASHGDHPFPYYLWGYATSVCPWAVIGGKAGPNDPGAILWITTAKLCGVGALIALLVGGPQALNTGLWAGALIGVSMGWTLIPKPEQQAIAWQASTKGN
jgi:hypothetical protein